MQLSFLKYFLGYVFGSKTRQKLIFLAIVGLLISAFSLTVLQGVMGGLQSGLIDRSKNVLGHGYIDLGNISMTDPLYEKLIEKLITKEINYLPELELELMIQNESYVSPIILHGLDYSRPVPKFLEGIKGEQKIDRSQIVVGSELGRALRSHFGSRVKVTSVAHTDTLLEDIPRQVTSYISDYFSSELPEIDSIHGWVRLSFMQNLVRDNQVNKIRFYEDHESLIKDILAAKEFSSFRYITWEEKHSSLVWALNLETRVMLFLFASMSVLIGICITSGFLIFYNKIKGDLASFWILGLAKDELFKLTYIFSQGMSILFCALGVILGVGFLFLLDNNQLNIMPEQFVERNIPVQIEIMQIILSFLIPYLVSSLFTHYTFKIFKKDNISFLTQIRKLG